MTCANCLHTNGWIEDDNGDPIGKCPCRPTKPAAEFHAAAVADAHPGDMTAALKVITDATQGRDVISANAIRYLLDMAGVKPQVRGPAFKKAIADGLLEPVDVEVSTGASAHGKPVNSYRVLRRSA